MTRESRTRGAIDPRVRASKHLRDWRRLIPVLAYGIVVGGLSFFRFEHWFATGWDLGFYQQGLWAIWHHGLWAQSSYIGQPVISDSASFVLWALAPFYHWLGTDFLLVLQTISLGIGFFAILQLAMDLGVSRSWAWIVGLIYLLYPVVIASNLYDFHPDVFAVPLLLVALHYALQRRWIGFAVTVFFALAMKDMVAVAVIGLGVSLLLGEDRSEKWVGLATVLAAIAWLFGTTAYLIPGLSGHAMSQWSAYYGQYGATPLQGAKTLLTHPWLLLAWVKDVRSWEYLVWIFGPLVGILGLGIRRFSRDWRWFIGGFLVLEINLLSRFAAQTSPFDQYTLFAVPSLFMGSMVWVKGIKAGDSSWRRLGALFVSAVFLLALAWHLHDTTWRSMPTNRSALAEAVAKIPVGVPVVAQNFVLPRVSDRQVALDANTLGSEPLTRGTYVILDPEFSTGNTPRSLVRDWVGSLQQKKLEVYAEDGVYLFRVTHFLPAG